MHNLMTDKLKSAGYSVPEIITQCAYWSAFIDTNSATISNNYCEDGKISVIANGNEIMDVNRFNDYIFNQFIRRCTMYKTEKYKPAITIDLDNGIYVFNTQSSTGKTRLCKTLRTNQIYGEPVASYTYDDYLLGTPIDSVLVPDKYAVIMLDRYDMYNGVGAELIQKCAVNSIVLIACKGTLKVGGYYDTCYIDMAANSIVVSE